MSTQNLISLWGAGGAIVVSFLAFGFSIYTYSQVRRSKRRKLINTIYHHADRTIEVSSAHQENSTNTRRLIENDPTYTPYTVITSSTDDLTYDQVIDALEWLKTEEEKAVISYFHSQSQLLALGQSFNYEIVRNLEQDRKLKLFGMFEQCNTETLDYARQVKKLLGKRIQFPLKAADQGIKKFLEKKRLYPG